MKSIFLVGYMGSGKSTIGRKLAERMSMKFIDTDVYIENRFRKRIVDLFALWGEAYFRQKEYIVLEELIGIEDTVISTGGGMPCFNQNIDLMNKIGITIYLNVPNDILVKRLELCKRTRPTIKDKTSEELVSFVDKTMFVRGPIYQKAHIIYDAGHILTDADEDQSVIDLIALIQASGS